MCTVLQYSLTYSLLMSVRSRVIVSFHSRFGNLCLLSLFFFINHNRDFSIQLFKKKHYLFLFFLSAFNFIYFCSILFLLTCLSRLTFLFFFQFLTVKSQVVDFGPLGFSARISLSRLFQLLPSSCEDLSSFSWLLSSLCFPLLSALFRSICSIWMCSHAFLCHGHSATEPIQTIFNQMSAFPNSKISFWFFYLLLLAKSLYFLLVSSIFQFLILVRQF